MSQQPLASLNPVTEMFRKIIVSSAAILALSTSVTAAPQLTELSVPAQLQLADT